MVGLRRGAVAETGEGFEGEGGHFGWELEEGSESSLSFVCFM